ncbi:3-oxoacyl-[acyl-carrier-protein] synthase III C-terminal domain-containing protein [Streptomyces sp. NPDC090109]|uniref:3-oxoacyl-[acyl-carrier-protein] synthase III C-terminal domain-containing protein n=1 Tax=unclassified Streptomyces TaxID=2593676 RepID=UPI000EF7A49A|nr:3-oxoacyl-[acyl-carrier-protein] synthase III C-terminal domain-containing protein [Streptomyces sp. S1]
MRLPSPLGISGPSLWLPPERQSGAEAVASGLVDAETAGELGYSALPVAALAPPEMAVEAGREALSAAGVDPAAVGLLLHAWIHYQGHDLWSPAHFVADRLGADGAVPLGVQQVCNGGAAAVELAASRLFVEPGLEHALVTTADAFPDPGFDRWSGDYGIGYGDGATALVLHHLPENGGGRPADLVLHAVTTVAAPRLERMHRGDDPFGPAARSLGPKVDIRRTKKAFLRDGGMEAFTEASGASLRTVVRRCLAEAGLSAADKPLRYVVAPRLGRKTVDLAYAPPLSELTGAELLRPGADTGHLGAGDAAASLAELHARRMLGPGEYALVVSAGAGFTWSCLLVSGA